jgi:hypothetical protein
LCFAMASRRIMTSRRRDEILESRCNPRRPNAMNDRLYSPSDCVNTLPVQVPRVVLHRLLNYEKATRLSSAIMEVLTDLIFHRQRRASCKTTARTKLYVHPAKEGNLHDSGVEFGKRPRPDGWTLPRQKPKSRPFSAANSVQSDTACYNVKLDNRRATLYQ